MKSKIKTNTTYRSVIPNKIKFPITSFTYSNQTYIYNKGRTVFVQEINFLNALIMDFLEISS